MSHMQAYPSPGTVVSVRAYLFWRHKGIVSDWPAFGRPTVISACARAGRVSEESWEVFRDGQEIRDEGYPSELPPHVVVQRARSMVGNAYKPLESNCDHLVTYAHGQAPNSPQLAATLSIGALALVWLWAARQGQV